MLKRIKRRLARWAKWSVRGEQFKRYTHPNAPASPGPRMRIAVCYLIPLLGDVVMLFPLLDQLRREQPDAEIVAFVSGMGRILRFHPAVNCVYERPRRMRGGRYFWPVSDIVSLWWWWHRSLREQRFDICVMLRGGADPGYAAHLAWLLGGRERVGYSAALEPERAGSDLNASPLLTREVTVMHGIHEAARGAEVLQLAGLISTPPATNVAAATLLDIARSPQAAQFLTSHSELARPYFIISPGASDPRKEWPEAGFAAVARAVCERGWLPVLVGGPEVRAGGERIAAQLDGPALNLAGETGFPELVAVCASAQCFFGNDSGTGHVAGAVGTPSVIISSYASSSPAVHQTSPQRTHPAGPWYAMVQPETPLSPCIDECVVARTHCIQQVKVDDVLEAFEALMDRRAADANRAPRQ